MALERLMSKVAVQDNGCWIWTASTKGATGYGQFSYGGEPRLAHRVAYELLVGPIPDGLEIDHLCRVRACVNPAHLEPVTTRENARRGRAVRTECPQGHPYDEHNTAMYRGWRCCKQCNRDRLAACLAVFTLGWAPLHALKTARWLDDRPSMARPGQRSNAPAPTLPHRGGGRVMPPMRRRQLDQFVAAHADHPVTARTGFAGAVHVAPAGPGRSSVTPTLPARTENEGEAS